MALRGSGSHDFFYGVASDGDVTLGINTTLTRDMFYKNLVVPFGIVLNPGAFKLHVKEKLSIGGVINRNGNPGAAGATPGAGGAGGPPIPSHALGGSGGGGAGGNVATNGTVGGSLVQGWGGFGGAGGDGDTALGGGAGIVSWDDDWGGVYNFFSAMTGHALGDGSVRIIEGGGGGGGGGGSDVPGAGDSSSGGGGGSGGGVIQIAAREIVFTDPTAKIVANGGRSANYKSGSGVHAGSGGGGGGGFIIVLNSHIDLAGQADYVRFQASGGDAGLGLGGLYHGTPGFGGKIILLGEFNQYKLAGLNGVVSDSGGP